MVWNSVFNFLNRGNIIRRQVRNNNSIIFGGQAIKKHIGFMARPTHDYDILSKAPKKSARLLERTLDNQKYVDKFYVRPALHPGTTKVMHVGYDGIKRTKDDITIADFSKPRKGFKTKLFGGIRYATLSEIKKDKRRSLRTKKFVFRHKKDKEDLNRIKIAEGMK